MELIEVSRRQGDSAEAQLRWYTPSCMQARSKSYKNCSIPNVEAGQPWHTLSQILQAPYCIAQSQVACAMASSGNLYLELHEAYEMSCKKCEHGLFGQRKLKKQVKAWSSERTSDEEAESRPPEAGLARHTVQFNHRRQRLARIALSQGGE